MLQNLAQNCARKPGTEEACYTQAACFTTAYKFVCELKYGTPQTQPEVGVECCILKAENQG